MGKDLSLSVDAPVGVGKLLFLLALALLLWFSFPALSFLVTAWGADEYSYGYFIPIIAVLMAAADLRERRPMLGWSAAGLAPLALGLLIQVVADLTANTSLGVYAFLLALAGLLLCFFGVRFLRVVAPALIYFVFAVPLPPTIFAQLTAALQLLSSTLGVAGLELVDIPVFQEGNVIDLGGMKLQVAEACSGLRYLFPMMSFGFLVAWMFRDSLWKRGLLFLSTIPISIFMNSLRITLIGVSVEFWGIQMAEGLLHEFEGWTMFLACTALLGLEAWALRRRGGKDLFRVELFTFDFRGVLTKPVALSRCAVAATALLVVALVGQALFVSQRHDVIAARDPLAQFPLRLGPWSGQTKALSEDELKSLKLTDYFLGDFTDDSRRPPVNFYVAYYATQRQGAAPHSPKICIPGGGWEIAKLETREVAIEALPPLKVIRALIKKGSDTMLVYFWLQERGHDMTGDFEAKWYLMRDALTTHRTDGALVRAVTAVTAGQDEAAADRRLAAYLADALPILPLYVPN